MIQIRPMSIDDVALGMRLREQAGWNQTRADWQRFLSLSPDGCFVAEWSGQPVATLTTCVFQRVGWIAMVLVEKSQRGQGIGSALLRRAMDYFRDRSVATVRLDATELGQPIYERMGFAPQFTVLRYAGRVLPVQSPANLDSIRSLDHEEIFQLDCEAVGYDRRSILTRFWQQHPDWAFATRIGGSLRGYILARAGSEATFLGPSIARDTESGQILLRGMLSKFAGESVYVDSPEQSRAAQEVLRQVGLAPSRKLIRMCFGEPVREQCELLWASSGPEKG